MSEVQEDTQEVQVDPVIEQEAREMGWVPQEDFRGDTTKWRSAEEFVERGREILPILRKNKEELLKSNRQLKAEIEEMKATFEDFKEYRKADKERVYKQAIQDLKSRKVEALEANQAELVVEIDDAIAELKEEQAKPVQVESKKAEQPQVDPIFMDWLSDNEWFEKNTTLQYAANAAGAELLEENPGLKGRKFLDKVAERVKEQYPEKFGGRREAPPTVEGSQGGSRSKPKKESYENMPQEAKSKCDSYVKQGLLTREEYVTEYWRA